MNDLDSNDSQYRAPALDKGLDILELLSTTDGGLTQGEIARALSRTPTELYRMIDTLVRRRYLSREGDTYGLTLKLFALAHQHPPLRRLVAQATPALRELSRWAEQSCHMATYDRGQVLVVAQFDSPQYYGLSIRLGSRIGLLNTGSGHVLLAYAMPEERKLMLSERGNSPGDSMPKNFDKQLARIRKRGYERMKSLQIQGVTNLSVPVIGSGGTAVAAVTVPFLSRRDRSDAPGLETVLGRCMEVASALSRYIGGDVTQGSPAADAVERAPRRRGARAA
jgi:DNA-binding IclR family transcriptional regulator